MATRRKPSKRNILEAVGHELKENEPSVVSSTRRKFGEERAEKQRKAILLSKARKLGAKIPRKSMSSR